MEVDLWVVVVDLSVVVALPLANVLVPCAGCKEVLLSPVPVEVLASVLAFRAGFVRV